MTEVFKKAADAALPVTTSRELISQYLRGKTR